MEYKICIGKGLEAMPGRVLDKQSLKNLFCKTLQVKLSSKECICLRSHLVIRNAINHCLPRWLLREGMISQAKINSSHFPSNLSLKTMF